MGRGNDTFFGNIVRASVELITNRIITDGTTNDMTIGDSVIITNNSITTKVTNDEAAPLFIRVANAGTVNDLDLAGGANTGTGHGGNVDIAGGSASTGVGGNVTLTSGSSTGNNSGSVVIGSTVANQASGNVTISTGTSTVTNSGNLNLFTGNGISPGALNLNAGDYLGPNGNGANITLRSGNGSGTGTDGEIIFNQGVSGVIVLPNISTVNLPATPSTGSIVYNTTTSTVQFFNGAVWANI